MRRSVRFLAAACCAISLLYETAAGQGKATAESVKFVFCPKCFERSVPGAKYCWNDGFALPNPEAEPQFGAGQAPHPGSETALATLQIRERQLALLVERLTDRLDAQQAIANNPNLIGGMTRTEFSDFLTQTLREQDLARRGKGQGTLRGCLEFVGGATLVLLGIGLVAAAGN